MAAPGQPRTPVATGGFLMLLQALYSYNFIYSRFPPTARSGPSSPSRARLSSSSSGYFLGRKGIRDRYREEPFPRRPFRANVRVGDHTTGGQGKHRGVSEEPFADASIVVRSRRTRGATGSAVLPRSGQGLQRRGTDGVRA